MTYDGGLCVAFQEGFPLKSESWRCWNSSACGTMNWQVSHWNVFESHPAVQNFSVPYFWSAPRSINPQLLSTYVCLDVIPSQMGQCRQLTELSLEDNELEGNLSWHHLPSRLVGGFVMSRLIITAGKIPSTLGNLRLLTVLMLANNKLTGKVLVSAIHCVLFLFSLCRQSIAVLFTVVCMYVVWRWYSFGTGRNVRSDVFASEQQWPLRYVVVVVVPGE